MFCIFIVQIVVLCIHKCQYVVVDKADPNQERAAYCASWFTLFGHAYTYICDIIGTFLLKSLRRRTVRTNTSTMEVDRGRPSRHSSRRQGLDVIRAVRRAWHALVTTVFFFWREWIRRFLGFLCEAFLVFFLSFIFSNAGVFCSCVPRSERHGLP